jgi:hypothetical protein
MDLVWRLYRGTGELSRGDFQSLAALGRPVLVLVTSSDLAARPDLADVLLDAGFREGLRAGDTAVYAWPESFAAGVGEPVR